jgi:hypothetical protein
MVRLPLLSHGSIEEFCGFEPWEPSPIPRNIEDEYHSFFLNTRQKETAKTC